MSESRETLTENTVNIRDKARGYVQKPPSLEDGKNSPGTIFLASSDEPHISG
ncbi:hypothetical protein LEMLEM_LOCUS11350, partial [Lemmus lemmus]